MPAEAAEAATSTAEKPLATTSRKLSFLSSNISPNHSLLRPRLPPADTSTTATGGGRRL